VTTIATAAPESLSASFWSSRLYVGRSSVDGVACEQAASVPTALAAATASATHILGVNTNTVLRALRLL
jgi:hypothetical protein